eukprot:gene34348-biopygen27164
MREFGSSVRDLDLLDETKLTGDQIKTVCSYIFGGSPELIPDPSADPSSFESKVDQLNSQTAATWCAIRNSGQPWINTPAVAAAIRS